MAVTGFPFFGTPSNPNSTSSGVAAATTPSPFTTNAIGSSSSVTSSVAPHPVGPLGPFSGTPSNPNSASSETSSGLAAATMPSPFTTYAIVSSSSSVTSSVAPASNSMFGPRSTGLPAPSLFRSGSSGPTQPSIPFGSNTTMVATPFPLLSPPPFGTSTSVQSPATGLFGSLSSSAAQSSSGISLTLSAPVVTGASTTPSSSVMLPSFGNRPFGGSAPLNVPLGSYLKRMSSEKAAIIKQIFERYGDITKESSVKSTEAKSAFLLLVVEAVERLRNYNLDSVDSHELDLIQQWTEDAYNLGFDVGWLEQKIAKFKYQSKLRQMKKMSEKVNVAKKALLEMEHQETILKKELDVLKSELGGSSPDLSEGLI